MTKLSDQIQEMQRRLTANALDEQTFVKALSEALNEVDLHLLKEVRRLGSEHETRRGLILRELQDLAGRICQLPGKTAAMAASAPASIGSMAPPIDHRELENQLNRVLADRSARHTEPHAPGDWRRATSAIEEDIDAYWRSPGASH